MKPSSNLAAGVGLVPTVKGRYRSYTTFQWWGNVVFYTAATEQPAYGVGRTSLPWEDGNATTHGEIPHSLGTIELTRKY
jgi:hypothetical protein